MSGNAKTSVAFAPTAAFVRAFGEEEANKQRAKFETNPLLPAAAEGAIDRDALVGVMFCVGVVVGCSIGVLFMLIKG
jgi:hypothetical protein